MDLTVSIIAWDCKNDLESNRVSRLTFCKRIVRQRLIYFNYMDLSLSIIDNDHELDRILERTF